MTPQNLKEVINRMFDSMDIQVPTYKESPDDWNISDGTAAVCLIDDAGNNFITNVIRQP